MSSPINACVYRGEMRNLRQLAALTGISARTLSRWLSEGVLAEGVIDAELDLRRVREKARAIGVGVKTLFNRVHRYEWPVELACSTPVLSRVEAGKWKTRVSAAG